MMLLQKPTPGNIISKDKISEVLSKKIQENIINIIRLGFFLTSLSTVTSLE